VKGHKKIGGRKKGTPNLMKTDSILAEAAQLGDKDEMVGHFSKIALNDPRAFCKVLARVLPKAYRR
jgi:hypothetical protein